MTLVSGNIRFVPIFEGFIGERASNDSQWGNRKHGFSFHGFRRYVFSTLRNKDERYYHIYSRISRSRV